MYDYKKDDEQLSKENSIGEFFAGGVNTSSDFKIRKEKLPGWAVDWARNRFNMDAKSVKFYVMDEKDADDQSAAASGNNIFVTSAYRNDEEVIKHELTHIYQQAIGTATESNAGDDSLEDEAVQVSKEGEISLAKNQTQSGVYILPGEKTNVVQSLGALAIAGIVLGGAALVAAGIAGGKQLFRKMRLKWILKHGSEKEKCECVGKSSSTRDKSHDVNDIFDRMPFEAYSGKEYLDTDGNMKNDMKNDAEVLYRAYINPYVSDDYFSSAVRPVIYEYRQMLDVGFKGFKHEEPALKYFDIDLTSSKDDPNLGPKLTRFMMLYVLTRGFKDRTVKEVSVDFKNLFNQDSEKTNEQDFSCINYNLDYYKRYKVIYNKTFKFHKISSKHIRKLSRRRFGELPLEAAVEGVILLIKLFSRYMGEVNKRGLDELVGNILKIADILHIKRTGDELKKLISDLYDYFGRNQIYSEYLRSGEIIPIIEDLVEIDKHKGKIIGNTRLVLDYCMILLDYKLLAERKTDKL